MSCPKCGSPVGESEKFCGNCGTVLTANQPQPVSSPAPTTGVAPAGPPWQASQPPVVVAQRKSNALPIVPYVVAFVFLILAVIAAVRAGGISPTGCFSSCQVLYALSAVGFLLAGVLFFVGLSKQKRQRQGVPYAAPGVSPPPTAQAPWGGPTAGPTPSEGNRCGSCGTPNAAGTAFCRQCGARMT